NRGRLPSKRLSAKVLARRACAGERILRILPRRYSLEEASPMKLATALSVLGLGLGTAAFATQGCSSDSSSSSSSTSAGKVPPSPEGAATTGSDERTFALNALFLGETDRAGVKNKDAWKDYGYNLDGLITNVTDPKAPDLAKVCNRADG